MSNPGDPGREQILLQGSPADIIVAAVDQLRDRVAGVRSLEFRYDALADDAVVDGEPGPDDDVRWTVTVTVRRRWPGTPKAADRDFVGTADAGPACGQGHGVAQVRAIAQVLEAFGANVVVVA